MVKFVDTATMVVESGKGGAGCVSMRHEKFIEFGGPDGGDGGKGGDLYFQGAARLASLQDVRLHPHRKAKNGQPGMGAQKTGKSGEDRYIEVPLGTVVINDDTDEICCEVLEERSYLLLRGGKGGLGNMHFKSSVNRTPRYAQPGLPGEKIKVRLDLKIIADVGLVGLPNAGKSTFVAAISNARPKIADYPFTTLTPSLGMVALEKSKSFVVADIPGIIENAHTGTGLGDRFLKHIQRTSVLAMLIDCSGLSTESPLAVYRTLLQELERFSPALKEKRRIVLLTKIDSLREDLHLDSLIAEFRSLGEEPFAISSVSRIGVRKVLYRLLRLIEEKKDGDHVGANLTRAP